VGEGRTCCRRVGQLTGVVRSQVGICVLRSSQRALVSIAALLFALHAAAALQDGKPPPYIGTPGQVVERMLALAKVTPADTVVDLGSGDGRIVIGAAKRYGARGLGVEMSGELVALSRRHAEREGVAARARFVQQDALTADLSIASVLTLYLSPELNEQLMPRILDTMRPGSRVVSHDFAIGTWTPDKVERLEVPEKNNGRGGESTIMLWIVPSNAAGLWRATVDAAASQIFEFSIAQQFQFIEGALHAANGAQRFTAASLSGDQIVLQLPPGITHSHGSATVSARLDGDTMSGTVQLAGRDSSPVPFSAHRLRARPNLF
jgi:SAM-dependent methyltransferase